VARRLSKASATASSLALVLAIVGAEPAFAQESVRVALHGDVRALDGAPVVLAVGSQRWGLDTGGGVVTVRAAAPIFVRLLRASDCRPILRFLAQPGASYVIRTANDGSLAVEIWESLDDGPALVAIREAPCGDEPSALALEDEQCLVCLLAALVVVTSATAVALLAWRRLSRAT
jgi:hypothetical protein